MNTDDLSREAADRRAEHGYALGDLDPAEPPALYDTGEVPAELENADIRHEIGEMRLTTPDARDAIVYPLVARDELKLVTETQGDGAAYAAATVVVDPGDAREIAAAIWQAAEDVEQLRADGAGATPADPDADTDAGGTVAVRLDDETLATARERLPADADARQARDVLADLADLDEQYRTADGRDAIAAVLADTAE